MECKKFGNKYVVRIDKGEEIVETLKKFCTQNNIKLGSVYGIGAVNKATIGLFEIGKKEYHSTTVNGDHEITSLVGNVSTMNGQTYLHIHVNLANAKHEVCGGHLNSAFVSATCELIVDAIEGSVDREFSQEIGLNLYKF